MAANILLALSTFPDAETARRISNQLVTEKFAACANILPAIESIYRWKNEVQREKEVLLLAKTTDVRFAELEKAVREMHSYDTPEIVALPVSKVSEPYRAWLLDSISSAS